jgi:hypothetical protein
MRRAFVSLLAVALCVVTAGCGSSSSKTTVSSPLVTELSYFPTGSPFVAAIATNTKGTAIQNAEGLLGAFPLAKLGIGALESKLESVGLDYQTDIEPLYGNPIMVGATEVPGSTSLTGSKFLGVWIVENAAKLRALLKKLPGFHASGHYDGATLYQSGASATFALDGATAVFGASAAGVDAALNRHAHGGGITSADFSRAMGNLPQDTLIQAFGSLTTALSSTGTANARKIPWVAAIRGYAASISASSGGITAQFRLDTSGGSLSAAELPIAAGTTAPDLAGTLPIAVGLRDPAQSLRFIEAAEQAIDPTSYAQFNSRENVAKSKTGYDLNTFAALLTSDLIIQSDTRTTMGRAEVSDSVSAAKQLAKLPQVVRDIFHSAHGLTSLPGGFYAINERNGKPLDLGLLGNEFVAGLATPAQLRAFATAPTTSAPNAQGAVAFRISLIDLLKIVVTTPPSAIVQSFLSSLGDVTGSASASPSALTGTLSLGVK